MSVLNRIAYFQNPRDEVPNQELARHLAEKKDHQGIHEIAENLWNKEQNIRSDCLKVLYETGYLAPELIAEYVEDFLKLLHDKNNRMVWGGMIALSTIASIKADTLFPHVGKIKRVMDKGTLITMDAGIKTLAGIASQHEAYRQPIFPYLLHRIATCRPLDVARHAEQIMPAVDKSNKAAFLSTLQKRMQDLSDTQARRVKKVIKEVEER